MEDEEFYYVSLYDGICDQTKQLGKPGKKLLTKKMQNDEKWVISSSGSHMFVNFAVDILMSKPGFTAKIHYGNMINDIKIQINLDRKPILYTDYQFIFIHALIHLLL